MESFSIKKIWPYLVAILLFIALGLIYFSPVLEGKKLKQGDIVNHKGMAKEIVDFRDKTGEEPLWTNSAFSGMPAYMISVKYRGNFLDTIDDILKLGLPHPVQLVFLYFLGFFILLLILRVNPWLAVLGSIGFAFSSYFFIILEAGHNTKAHAIGYMAPVLGGIILAYRGKYFWGAALTALFLGLELAANHLQITYYLMLVVIIFAIAQFIESYKKKELPHFFKASAVLAIAALLAVGANVSRLWAAMEYGKYTIRGKTELTTEKDNRTSGLDIDYATQWSYGVAETFTLLIPDFKGGASGKAPSENSETFDELSRVIPPAQARQYLPAFSMYWGEQPFTSGPVYAGAIMVFLFVLGLIVVKGKLKWWLLAATLLGIMLAWGKNFMPLTEFFLHYMPGYNKFRAVSMTLVIADLTIPILGMLALKEITRKDINKKDTVKSLAMATGITGGIILGLIAFAGGMFNFSNPQDMRLVQAGFPQSLLDALEADRLSLLRAEGFRSLIFILLAAALIWALVMGKLKKEFVFIGLILLVTIDMWTVNKRYLNNENFERARAVDNPFTPNSIDQQILADKDPNFRVYNRTIGDPFADSRTSFFHKSVGGYHGAKLRRYQELYEHHLAMGNPDVINMLNVKYLIVPGANNQPRMQPNPGALGNAWTVKDYRLVENADEEIQALDNFNAATEAIIDKRFADQLEGFEISPDPAASIKLTSYQPNELKYNFKSGQDELVVFSEIYYDKGWNVYVDGEKMPYFRTNYVLRGMIVPAGEHEIVWKFEPAVYYTGGTISAIASIIIILIFFAALGTELKAQFAPSRK
jgi:hypothetical protein